VPSNDSILTRVFAGNKFVMDRGDEDEKVMNLIDAFKKIDLDGIW